jgi:hypothetical protein
LFLERRADLSRGQKQVDFAAHQYRITVWLNDGKVVRLAYQPQYSTLSGPDLNQLLAANKIGSYAEWKYTGSDDPTHATDGRCGKLTIIVSLTRYTS